MGQQLIENLWPFFGFARLMGMFPYKRIMTENGMMELKPISKITYLLYGCIRWTLTTVSISLVTTWFFFKTTRTYDQWSQCLVDYNGGQSVTNQLALLFLLVFSTFTGILLQNGNFKIRANVCELSSQFKKTLQQHDSLSSPIFTFIGSLFAKLFTTTLYTYQLVWICQNCLGFSLINALPLPIIYGLTHLIGSIPLFVFLAITLDHFNGLTNEIKNLTEIIVEHKLNRTTLYSFSNIIIRLEKVRSSLSSNLFWAISCLSVVILVFLYNTPAAIIGYLKTKEWILLFGAANSLLIAIRFLSLIWFINNHAQRVTNQVHQLKDCLQDTFISGKTNINVRFEGQIVPLSFMRDRIVGKLGNFSGFDGKGYFVLGKSFMTTFLGLLLTYFIILLNWKISEI